ncbi:MAG: HAMP domain-containing histidine kinase [Candidatus Marinimicrobia bacterium]|nr:HAMP domain-containing histidine kinase [Candidatus Neomarinimicrobiota bacterium]
MLKKNNKSNLSSLDLIQIQSFFDSIYRYSNAINSREIAHSINNILTVLSMQHAMLIRSLNDGKTAKAIQRAEVIREVLNDLRNLSENLAKEKHITPFLQDVFINNIVNETLSFAQIFPNLSECEILIDLMSEPDVCHIEPDSIRMLLLSFLQNATSIYSKPDISISTFIDKESGKIILEAIAKEGEQPGLDEFMKEKPEKVGSKPGEIPLRFMKGFVESLNSNVQLFLIERERFGFTCHITPIVVY